MSSHGNLFQTERLIVFFGNRHFTTEKFPQLFPNLSQASLKQTHSAFVVRADADPTREADAHFTNERGLALCIRTADCLPVLIHDPKSSLIAAVHAGWRGIENEIIKRTCAQLNSLGADLKSAEVWIGPHIGPNDFEVGLDVGQRLLATYKNCGPNSAGPEPFLPHADTKKIYINLEQIARAQLASCAIRATNIRSAGINTFQSSEHASFRRDASQAGRQISFIAIKPTDD